MLTYSIQITAIQTVDSVRTEVETFQQARGRKTANRVFENLAKQIRAGEILPKAHEITVTLKRRGRTLDSLSFN